METYPDELVELIAWTWTEGSRGDGLYKLISQSHRVNNQYVSRIRNCLTRLYGPGKTDSLLHYKLFPAWRELKNELKGMTAFSFNNHIGKLLWSLAPGGIASLEFIKKLTLKQLNLFINSSVDADGCRTGDRGRCRFAQKEEPRIASLEFACVLAGITTTRKRREDVWVMNLSGRQYSTPLRSDLGNITTVRESGIVWCPTTKNGTWLARRNGKIYFTGNSNRVYNALGFGAFLLHPYCTGLASTYIGGLDLLYYEDRRDLHNLIAEYMDRPEKREEIAINGLSVTIHSHLYRHRCEELMGVVNARRRQQPRILEKETGSGKEG
jgi:hypothetical protein